MLKQLFGNDERRLTAWVDRLCKSQQEALGDPKAYAFIYNGTFYRQSNVVGRIDGKKQLAPHLTAEMENFLKDKSAVDNDRAYTKQTLVNLLDGCDTLQDVRDTLPECLVCTLPQLRGLDRKREPACTIQSNPRALRHYVKILPVMEAYAAARLVF